MNMNAVRLNVGEKIKSFRYDKELYSVKLSNGQVVNEVVRIEDGRDYVFFPDKTIMSLGGAEFKKFSEVYVCSPVAVEINSRTREKADLIDTLEFYQFLNSHLEGRLNRGLLSPFINGIRFLPRITQERREIVKRGKDKEIRSPVLVDQQTFVPYQIIRYAPATPENKKKIEDIFGIPF
ncbi:hypothetical protein KW787_04250 [Candidatus Pacearchaeota archaeon]|nr:hypothetical protein [Candidatus Pacearchaeota archaeon]